MTVKYYWAGATGANDGTSEANAWTDPATAFAGLSPGDILYMKTPTDGSRDNIGNFQKITVVGTIDDTTIIEGYADTPGDGGPFLCYTGYLEVTDGSSIIMKYWDISNGGGGYAYQPVQNLRGTILYRCKVESLNPGAVYAAQINTESAAIECCFIANGTSEVVKLYKDASIFNCYIQQNSSGSGIANNIQYTDGSQMFNNIIVCTDPTNTSPAVHIQGFEQSNYTHVYANNTIYGFGSGFKMDASTTEESQNIIMYGNVIYNCATGIENSQTVSSNTSNFFSLNNAFGNISGSNHSGLSTNGILGEVQLTASPFEDTTDFVINDAAGGGALLKGLLGAPDIKGLTLTDRVSYGTHGAVIPSMFFETTDIGSFDGRTGGVGDTITTSGRSFQLVQDNPRVWRRV